MAVEVEFKQADEYAGEAGVRRDVVSGLEELGFTLQSYALKDKDQERTLTITAAGDSRDCQVRRVMGACLSEHDYDNVEITVSIKALRVVGQTRLALD